MNPEKLARLKGIGEALLEEKRAWNSMAQEIALNCYPLRANFTQGLMLGASYADGLMESTPVNNREELGNTIDAMLRQGEWFRLSTGDDDRDNDPLNARALERGTMLMQRAIIEPRMSFKPATKEADHDYVAFGQNLLSVEENEARDFVKVKAHHPGHAAWTLNEDGDVEQLFMRETYTVREIARNIRTKRWNGELPDALKVKLEQQPNTKVNCLVCCVPTDEVYADDGPTMRRYARTPYLKVVVDLDDNAQLHENGEPMCPFVAGRWRSFTGMPYGFSPSAMNSLGDMRMLQMLAMIILEVGEKTLDPPMIMSQEVFTRSLNMYAGGGTYVDLGDRNLQDVMTTISPGKLEAGLELKQDVRAMITDAWLLNKLYLPSAREMRELEVAVRTEEFRRAALPFFQPIESDYHPRLLGKIFDRMVVMGRIPREMFPAALAGEDVKFSFTSPLNEAEGKKVLESYNASVQTIAAGAQLDETVGHLFNIKQATIDAVRGAGGKSTWIYSGDEQKQRMKEAQQAEQLAKAAQIANQGAQTVSNVAAGKAAAEAAGMVPQQ